MLLDKFSYEVKIQGGGGDWGGEAQDLMIPLDSPMIKNTNLKS